MLRREFSFTPISKEARVNSFFLVKGPGVLKVHSEPLFLWGVQVNAMGGDGGIDG